MRISRILKKKGQSLQTKKIHKLAEFMHDEYEKAARMLGWKTQESCHVKFDDLPETNKQTMLYVAQQIYYEYINQQTCDSSGDIF